MTSSMFLTDWWIEIQAKALEVRMKQAYEMKSVARSPLVVQFSQRLRACRARIGISQVLDELFRGIDWKSKKGFGLLGSSDVPVE